MYYHTEQLGHWGTRTAGQKLRAFIHRLTAKHRIACETICLPAKLCPTAGLRGGALQADRRFVVWLAFRGQPGKGHLDAKNPELG